MSISKNIFWAFILTVSVGVVYIGGVSLFEKTPSHVLTMIFIMPFVFGVLNIIFLIVLYALRVGREYLTEIRYLVIEILLMYGISFLVSKAIDAVPTEYKFDITPALTSLKIYFLPSFQFLYVFCVLTVVLLIIKRFFIKKNHLSENSDNIID